MILYMTSIFIPPADEFNKEYVDELVNNLDKEINKSTDVKTNELKTYVENYINAAITNDVKTNELKTYTDAAISKLNTDIRAYNNLNYISKNPPEDINMSGRRIMNLGIPNNDKDAASREYINRRIDAVIRLSAAIGDISDPLLRIGLTRQPIESEGFTLSGGQTEFLNLLSVTFPQQSAALRRGGMTSARKNAAEDIFSLPNAFNIIEVNRIIQNPDT